MASPKIDKLLPIKQYFFTFLKLKTCKDQKNSNISHDNFPRAFYLCLFLRLPTLSLLENLVLNHFFWYCFCQNLVLIHFFKQWNIHADDLYLCLFDLQGRPFKWSHQVNMWMRVSLQVHCCNQHVYLRIQMKLFENMMPIFC